MTHSKIDDETARILVLSREANRSTVCRSGHMLSSIIWECFRVEGPNRSDPDSVWVRHRGWIWFSHAGMWVGCREMSSVRAVLRIGLPSSFVGGAP